MTIFVISVMLLLFSGLLAPLSRKGAVFWDRLSLALGISGTVLGIIAVSSCLLHPESASLALPWPGINGWFSLRIDGLAALFLFPAFFIAGAGLLYGCGYLPHSGNPGSSAWVRFFYPILAAGIAMVFAAGNGVVFLISWELMALAGYSLIITERQDEECQKAGLLYLISTHTGTLALFGMFSLLGEHTSLVTLPQAGSLTHSFSTTGTAVFLLALAGFGLKAGIMPLHIWLPGAHAAAPSHVSALMSGVLIKTGIYGILRIVSLFQALPAWWGWLVLALGIVSGIMGVLFAIAQHDIKRLLAYHSIENIGIILLGAGCAMLGRTFGSAAAASLGIAGALLHVVNHGLFKGLLFLSAGSMIHATGSRQLADYGGLLRLLPLTAFFFLGGAVAICGLPPLNGFVSEWLVYLSLLQAGTSPAGTMTAALIAIPALAMIGGLALLCFAKVFGLSFLGMPRSPQNQPPHEAPGTMLTAMGLLLAACLWIGIAPATVLPLLSGAAAKWTNLPEAGTQTLAALAPAGFISLAAFLLLALLFLIFLAGPRGRNLISVKKAPTWGCGYGRMIARPQYSTSSFAEMILKFFSWILMTDYEEKKPQGLFPATGRFKSHTPDGILDLLLIPGSQIIAGLTTRIRRTIHQGMIGIYLLYFAVVLCLLLAVAIFWK